MYAICNSMLPLSDSLVVKGSYCEALCAFLLRYPGCCSIDVYRVLNDKHPSPDSYVHYVSLDRRKIDRFKLKFLNY